MERMSGSRLPREEGFSVLFLLKCLLFSYILSALMLMLLALLLYKIRLSEGMVSIAISAIYVLSTFAAGFVAGKKQKTRRCLWGMLMGAVYFVVLAVISLLVNQSVGALGNSFLTTLTLCTAGATLGGMMG